MADELNIESSYVMDLAKELVSMASAIVVKREDIAQRYETIDTRAAYDEYIAALQETDSFDGYASYDVDMMVQVGMSDAEIALALKSKRNIPSTYRDELVLLKRAQVIANFDEQNNYYRMLNGRPFTTDYLDIYITDTVDGVDNTKPVHEMSDDEIYILNNLGYIEALQTKYPDRAYLKYLGSNKIDVVTARTAKRFEIIRSGTPTNTDLKKRFDLNYVKSRAYILNNYYRRRYSIDQTYFDAYIGLMIMVNAMVMTVNDSIDIFNAKEFSNDITIKQWLQSYNADMFDDVPYIYRKKIADNIIPLIVSKGTDEVINKIFAIFGFDDITVRKFILVKEHLKDDSGNYIFSYEDDGVTPKYSEMYDVYFSQVDITSENIINEIRSPENKLAYVDVVASDPYWGGYESDEAIRLKLLERPFNYIDTDYININTAYEMSKLSFEVSYFLSTILSLQSFLSKLLLTDPFTGQEISVFYAITMLSALISKKVGFEGNIITDPADIAVIHKFNFDRSLTDITAILQKHNYSTTASYATILPSGAITDPSQLIDLYFKNKDIYDQLMTIKTSTRDLHEYMAVQELLEYLTQSKLSSTVYTKTDGTVAATYFDYLENKNPVVYSYLETLVDTQIDTAIFKLLSSLEEFIHSDRFNYIFLKIPTVSTENVLKTYMLKLINTFKAFTINVYSMSVTYNIDDTNNNIKILDKTSVAGQVYYHNNMVLNDELGVRGNSTQSTTIRISDELELIAYKGGN